MAGTNNAAFDLDNDNVVGAEDQRVWVEDLKNTYFGDANLDGRFDSGDLVAIFKASLYENDVEGDATWSTGDWNGDGEFDSTDILLAFKHARYEAPAAAVAAATAADQVFDQANDRRREA